MRMVFPSTLIDTDMYDFDLQVGDNFLPVPPYALSPNNIIAAVTPLPGDTTRSVFTDQSSDYE